VLRVVEVVEESKEVVVDWVVVVEKVVGTDVLGGVEDEGTVDDGGEQLSTSAPGPEMGVKFTPSIPKRVPASSVPYDVITILTMCVSPFTITGTPNGSQLDWANSNAPPQDTLSTKIWKPVK